MSPTRKKPKEGFIAGGWHEGVRVGESFRLFKLSTLIAESDRELVEKLKEDLNENYQPFAESFEKIVNRFITRTKLSESAPDTGEVSAMLDKWESAIQSLLDLTPDSFTKDLVDGHLECAGINYAKFKKQYDEYHERQLTAIRMVQRELPPTKRGRRENLLNKAVVAEIRALLRKYKVKTTKYPGNIWSRLIRIAFDAAGEWSAVPRNYIQ